MKKAMLVLLAMFLLCGVGMVMSHAATDITAQFTDANFRAAVYGTINKTAPEPIYDDDVAGVTNLYASYKNIESLNGLQYFTSLKGLSCNDNKLTALPTLPSSLETLWCGGNQLTTLPTLPSGLQYLYCNLNKLTTLPALPSGLKTLDCSNTVNDKGIYSVSDPKKYNAFTSLPALPASLTYLNCSNLPTLPTLSLPSALDTLYCIDNQWTSLPALPNSLKYLYCYNNKLETLPTLPSGLQYLDCQNNQLTALPALPSNLVRLNCNDNQLTELPTPPSKLERLYCNGNQLATLPALPGSLTRLYCENNQLTSLPTLPSSLGDIECQNNKLTTLNVTGLTNLYYLNCSYNDMTSKVAVVGFTGTWDDSSYIFDPQNVASATCTITYNTKGGTGGPTPQVGIVSGTTVTLSTIAPAREAYIFKGWATTDGGTAVVTSLTVYTNTTVYAVWEPFTPPTGPSDKLLGFFIDFFGGAVEIATVATWIARYMFFGWLWGQML